MEKILYCPYLYTQTQWSNYCATKPLPLEPVCPAIIMLFNNIALSNKPFILNNFVTAQNFDIFFVIQTLLKPDDCRPLHRTLPKFLNSPRCSGHGGGIAVVYKVYLICVPFDACSFDSFDLVSFNYSITIIVRSFYLTPSANFLILLSLISLPCLPMSLNFF